MPVSALVRPGPECTLTRVSSPRRLGIGVGHAGGVALVARRDQLDAGFHQRVRDLEIGGAEQAEAAARAVGGEVVGKHGRNGWIFIARVHATLYPTSRFGSHVAIIGNSSSSASSSRLMIT